MFLELLILWLVIFYLKGPQSASMVVVHPECLEAGYNKV